MKRMICVLAVFCLLLTMVPAPAWAETMTQMSASQVNTLQPKKVGKGTIAPKVNPLYADVLDKLEVSSILKSLTVLTEPQNEVYVEEEELASEIRENLKQRNENFTVYVKTQDPDLAGVIVDAFYAAFDHTGVPTEGDYLAWQYGGWGAEYYYYYDQGCYYVEVPFVVMYYVNGNQEAEMDRAVEALLAELDLDGGTDYEKVCGVYEYITENITYDYYHLQNDPNYLLMYTAYAALVDGTAVCQGYANLLYRLLLELGVDNRIVVGDAGGPHAWNIVEMEDWYYYADSTWDATYVQAGWDYAYFLRGSDIFTQDHTPDLQEVAFVADYPISRTDYQLGQPGQPGGEPDPDPEQWPVTGACGDNVTWSLTEDGVLTISGTGAIWDYPVDYPGWYHYVERITECVIEDGVTAIGDYVFYDCWNLTSVSIPASVTSIGIGAFAYCESLISAAIPDGVTSIEDGTFADCYSLTSVSIPASVTSIGDLAFAGCYYLGDVYFGGTEGQWNQIGVGSGNEELLTAVIHFSENEPGPGPGPMPEFPEADFLKMEWEVLKLTNRERAKAGLAPLTTSELLFQATDIRVLELMESYSHSRPDGNSFDTALSDLGIEYRMAGENKDAGCSSPAEVVNAWMGVPESMNHILGSNYAHMGVGYKESDDHTYSTYWDQLFYTDEYCHYIGFELSEDALTVEQGTPLDDLQLWATLTCAECGECYLPILEEYCTGYDPNTLGTQTVTVSGLNFSDAIQITVVEATEPELDLPECLESEWEVLRLTNRERHKEGLAPVTTQDILLKAAGIRASEITELFDHVRPDGSNFSTVLFDVDYPWYSSGENIAAGQQTPAEVVTGWMNSPSHRDNILYPDFLHLGVGYVPCDDSYGHYWVQLFTTGWECEYTKLELGVKALEVERGTELEELRIWARATCSYCGDCYLPVLPEYCTGYDSETPGTQTVTVSCLGKTDTLEITVLGDSTDCGDASGDGKINALDAIVLRQYLAGWEVSVDPTGADANGDGKINALDAIVLRQYLAGWDVPLGPQT